MTVEEWRTKHKKCFFCEHCYMYAEHTALSTGHMCKAKMKRVDPSLPRPFCQLFKLEEDENGSN